MTALSSSSPLQHTPWMLIGDFNQILTANEHYSIKQYDLPLRGMKDLRSSMEDNNLCDLSSRGAYYTWSN